MTKQSEIYTQMQMRIVELTELSRVLHNDMDRLIQDKYLDYAKLNENLETFKNDLAIFHTRLFKTESHCIKFMEEKLRELLEMQDE